MNVYDFDGTIYKGDSSVDLYLYSLKKDWTLMKYWPRQLLAAVKYKLGIYDKTQMKQQFFYYLRSIKDIDKTVEEFWKLNEYKIYDWYLKQKRTDDIIVSASPEFSLKPICEKLNIRLIASNVDKKTGIYTGVNCRGIEKARRLKEEYGVNECDAFYSDNKPDEPVALIAKKAYLVKNGNIKDWEFNK